MTDSFKDILVCPYSLGNLIFKEDKFISEKTGDEYPIVNGQPDLRLKRSKDYPITLPVGMGLDRTGVDFKCIENNPNPDINFDDMDVPHHLGRHLMSYFPKAKGPGYVLDLGCGTGLHKTVCEKTGYTYIGMDYASKQAAILADGMSLPFKDNSIDFIISISVLEHVQHPLAMAKEVYRVLKPGGRFMATLSFLEPFHDDSYYHSSHLGVLNTLTVGGFKKIIVLSPNKGWEGIDAISVMHYFSKMPWFLAKAIVSPVYWLHRLWWKWVELRNKPYHHPFNDKFRLLASSGSFILVVDK